MKTSEFQEIIDARTQERDDLQDEVYKLQNIVDESQQTISYEVDKRCDLTRQTFQKQRLRQNQIIQALIDETSTLKSDLKRLRVYVQTQGATVMDQVREQMYSLVVSVDTEVTKSYS